MSGLLDGKTALVMGVANRWSIAWAIARAFAREGARLVFTFQGERQEEDVRALAAALEGSRVLPCDVSQDAALAALAGTLAADGAGSTPSSTRSRLRTARISAARSLTPRGPDFPSRSTSARFRSSRPRTICCRSCVRTPA